MLTNESDFPVSGEGQVPPLKIIEYPGMTKTILDPVTASAPVPTAKKDNLAVMVQEAVDTAVQQKVEAQRVASTPQLKVIEKLAKYRMPGIAPITNMNPYSYGFFNTLDIGEIGLNEDSINRYGEIDTWLKDTACAKDTVFYPSVYSIVGRSLVRNISTRASVADGFRYENLNFERTNAFKARELARVRNPGSITDGWSPFQGHTYRVIPNRMEMPASFKEVVPLFVSVMDLFKSLVDANPLTNFVDDEISRHKTTRTEPFSDNALAIRLLNIWSPKESYKIFTFAAKMKSSIPRATLLHLVVETGHFHAALPHFLNYGMGKILNDHLYGQIGITTDICGLCTQGVKMGDQVVEIPLYPTEEFSWSNRELEILWSALAITGLRTVYHENPANRRRASSLVHTGAFSADPSTLTLWMGYNASYGSEWFVREIPSSIEDALPMGILYIRDDVYATGSMRRDHKASVFNSRATDSPSLKDIILKMPRDYSMFIPMGKKAVITHDNFTHVSKVINHEIIASNAASKYLGPKVRSQYFEKKLGILPGTELNELMTMGLSNLPLARIFKDYAHLVKEE